MKNVQYQIQLLDSPGNAAALKGLTDSIKKSFADVEASITRVGESARNASRIPTAVGVGGGAQLGGVPDYSKQLAELDRFKRETESRFSDMGKSAREDFEKGISGIAGDLKISGENAGKKFRDGFEAGVGNLTVDMPGTGGRELGQSQADALSSIGANVERLEELDRVGGETSKELSKNFREIAQGAEQGASGIGQMASGLAFLFADSKDAKVLIDSLLKIKGTADVLLGGFKALSGGAQFFSLFSDRAELNAKAQKNQAEASQLASRTTLEYVKYLEREGRTLEEVTGGNKAHASALREVADAAEKAAREEKKLNNEQDKPDGGIGSKLGGRATGGRGRRGKGGFLAGAIGLFGSSATNAIGNAVGDNSGIVDSGLDMALDNADRIKGLGKYAKYAKGAGAIGSALAIGKIGYDTLDGGGEIKQDSLSGKFFGGIGSSRMLGRADRALGLDTTGAALAKSFEQLDKAVKANQKSQDGASLFERQQLDNQAERNGANRIADFRVGADAKLRGLSVANGDRTSVASAGINSAAAAKDLAAELENIKRLEESAVRYELDRNDALERAATLYERQISAQESVIAAVQQEASERKRLNSESIGAAEQRIGLVEREKGLYQSAEQKIEAAAQKFARLSEEEKAQTLNAKQVADSGGILSKKQKGLLDSVGLGGESAAVKRQDLAEARKSGFFDNFGGFEKQQMQGSLSRADRLNEIQRQAEGIGQGGTVKEREAKIRALNKAQEGIGLQQSVAGQQRADGQSSGERRFDAQAQQVRVEIADRKEFNVKIEANTEAIVRGVVEQVRQALAAQEINLNKMVAEGVKKQQAENGAAQQARDLERRQAIVARK